MERPVRRYADGDDQSVIITMLFQNTNLDDNNNQKSNPLSNTTGTTGLQVRDRLAGRDDLEIISISDDMRKDANERKRLINEADCVILCK